MSNGDTVGLEWAGTVIGAIVILSTVATLILVTLGFASLSGISQSWFMIYSILLLASMTQVYGPDTMKVVDKFRQK